MSARNVGRWNLVGAGAAAVLLAGCGGGGGGGASDDVKSSVNAFLKDRDCSRLTPAYRVALTGSTDVKACTHDLGLRNKVKDVTIGTVSTSGSTATAVVTVDGTKTNLQLRKQGGTWLIAGDDDTGTSTAATTPAAPTATIATTPPADRSQATAAYAAALLTYRDARKRFAKRSLSDIRARNLSAVQTDFRDFRDALFGFDAAVRKITFPPDAVPAVNRLLESNRTEIADLDLLGAAPGFTELRRLLVTRFQDDDTAHNRALDAVDGAL